MATQFTFRTWIYSATARCMGLLFTLTFLPIGLQAQLEGPESISYDPNNPSNIALQWEGPWADNTGWNYWRASMGDGARMWVWDNGQGERRIGYDINNDGLYEKWQEELTIPGLPLYQIYHWDKNQDGTDNTIAWAEAGKWIEKVWDSNSDGLFDSWCSYTQPGCVQYIMGATCDLVEKKFTFDNAYRQYLNAQSGSAIAQKRSYSIYQRADLVFRICKNINMR